MSDYRPWELKKPEPAKSTEPAAAVAPHRPPTIPDDRDARPHDLEATKVVAAPGMDIEVKPKGDGGRAVAAIAILMGGGFLFIAALLMLLATGAVIDVSQIQGNSSTVEEATTVRAYSVPILFLVSSPALAAGFGLVYRRRWARPFGQAVAGLQILSILGIPLGVAALAGLARWRPR